MKKRRFEEGRIAFAAKQQHGLRTRAVEICSKMGISDATFYKWRQKYAGLGPLFMANQTSAAPLIF